MKKIILLVVLLALYLVACKPNSQSNPAAQNRKNKNTAIELIELEKNRLNALAQQDSNQLKQMVSIDFVLTTAYGELKNLQELLQNYQTRYLAGGQEKQYTKSTQVNIYNNGNTAILRGIYIVERNEKGGMIVLTTRYTDTYVRDDNTWKLIASHFSRIKKI